MGAACKAARVSGVSPKRKVFTTQKPSISPRPRKTLEIPLSI